MLPKNTKAQEAGVQTISRVAISRAKSAKIWNEAISSAIGSRGRGNVPTVFFQQEVEAKACGRGGCDANSLSIRDIEWWWRFLWCCFFLCKIKLGKARPTSIGYTRKMFHMNSWGHSSTLLELEKKIAAKKWRKRQQKSRLLWVHTPAVISHAFGYSSVKLLLGECPNDSGK